MASWIEVFSDGAFVTAIAAEASETHYTTSIEMRDRYSPFNSLIVQNRDVVDIRVELDSGSGAAGKLFEVQAGQTFTIVPDDGIYFATLKIKNLDTAVAVTASTIRLRWAKAMNNWWLV